MNFSNIETKRYPAHQFFYYRDHRGIFFHVFTSIETAVVSYRSKNMEKDTMVVSIEVKT